MKTSDFPVTAAKAEVVAAALPIQDHWLPLSNLDLLLPPVDVGVFLCYGNKPRQPLPPFAHMVGVLKKALAQTLVLYYAFSGHLVGNAAGEPELLCDNSGVDFVEASADVELEELDLYNPDASVEGKLVPARKRGVLAAQATQLKCGGVVVAITFSHQVADAYSANMFLLSWAEMARHAPPSLSPSFRRSVLLPRRPGDYHHSIDNMYVPISSLPPPPDLSSDANPAAAVSRIYYIEADRINELQTIANSNSGSRHSKLEAFCAFLWKIIASGDAAAGNRFCRLGIVVDGRSRLIDGGDENEAKLIRSYFGNVLSIPFGELPTGDLKQNSLNWIADRIGEFLRPAATKEHFLGLIDWVEEHRPNTSVSKIYAAAEEEEAAAVVVSSGRHFPAGKLDFGWGPPAFGSYHFPWGGESGYVMPMPSPKENGDWVVYVHLVEPQLHLIETVGGHVFNRLSSHYLFS
ncbi:coniferyl alcohol acyltransferase-like [Andrographis paniculata]|uniref:coniferyl alcohol acyltransferase-like n=1 Tax=Andrographis paniculata TaxID=175694 RepID=UPI0021E9AE80|nr:coniferyl alcohol acyltransferase-like [Andrographis paniculata]